jgi:dipeptidyl aminopeptidase/acylaminoacyl peptidase
MPFLHRLAPIAASLAFAAPAHATPPLEDYGRLPAVEMVNLSPSGEKLAFIAVSGEQRRLFAGPIGGAKLSSLIGQSKVRGIDWAGDDHVLVSASQTFDLPLTFVSPRLELFMTIGLDLNSKKMSAIFAHKASVYPAILGDYGSAEVDGKWYGYFAAITLEEGADNRFELRHGWPDLYRVDLTSGDARIAGKGTDAETRWLVAPDGKVVAHSSYNQASGQWRLAPGDFAGQPLLTRRSLLDSISLEGFGRTPDTVLVGDDVDGKRIAEEVSLKDGRATPLFEDVEPEAYLFSRKDATLIGAMVQGPRQAVFFDPQRQARFNAARKAFDGQSVRLVSNTDDLGRIVVFTDGGDDSGTYWFIDIPGGKAAKVGEAYPGIDPASVGSTRLVTYKAADGLELDGVLTLPPGREARKLPVVVMPHGGPIGPYDRIGFDWWAQAFASRGYAVFQPNYRGSGGHGLAFERKGYGEWGRKMQTDVSDGLARLVADGVVDPRRACIVGASYGGYAALAGVTLQQGLYRCAVSYGGVSDLKAMLGAEALQHGGRSDEVRFWRAAMGVGGSGEALLDQLSPDRQAEKADAPVLLIYGKDDTVVAPEQSTRMASALKRAGKTVEVVTLAQEDHWLSREETRIATLKASVAFVEKHNPAN